MKLKSLQLQNFRCFEDLTIDFSEHFTVLIGDSGTGKTSILDGVSVALGALLLGFDDVKSRHIRPDEARVKRTWNGETSLIEQHYPVSIHCEGVISLDTNELTWMRNLNKKNGTTTKNQATDIINYAKFLQKNIREEKEALLPLVAYYGIGRISTPKSKLLDSFNFGSRTQGYINCLDPHTNEKQFTNWLRVMQHISLKKGEEPEELVLVKKALENLLGVLMKEDNKNNASITINYNSEVDEVQVTLEDGKILPFKMLSSGYRNTIGMIADIAFRMSILNPQLKQKTLALTPGVVLIDEIELHLHPKWQRKIVGVLRRTFPNIQFIATTYSPFIIQSLKPGELRILSQQLDNIIQYGEISDDNTLVALGDYGDKSIEDITENFMGVTLPQWSERKREMYEAAEQYFRLLKKMEKSPNEQLTKYKEKLDELSKPYAENVAYYAFLNQKRLLVEEKKRESDQ